MLTHEEWMTLLAPVLAAVFGVLALAITAIGTGLVKRLSAYLEAKGQAEASRVVADAGTRMQNAMANEAGNIGLEIQAGHLDVTDLAAVRARALQGEAAIIAKLPQAVDVLKPLAGAVAQGIAGKILAQAGAPLASASAAAASTALLDAVNGVRAELQQQARQVAA